MSLKLYLITEKTCLMSDMQKPLGENPREPTTRTWLKIYLEISVVYAPEISGAKGGLLGYIFQQIFLEWNYLN